MSTPEFEVHRAIVHSSDTVTGAAEVRIPSLLGAGQTVNIPTTGLTLIAGEWNVPSAGSSAFVAVSADRTQFLWLTGVTVPTDSDIDFTDNVTIGGDLTVDGDIDATHINSEFDGPVVISIKNTSASTIVKGTPVYATGSVGQSGAVEVSPSRADTSGTMPALGLTQVELAPNGEGHAVVLGVIDQVDTSAYTINDSLYVAPTGGLTNTRPTGSDELVQKIGRVVRVNQSTGEILVLGAGRTNDVPNVVVAGGLTIDTDTLVVDSTNDRVGIGTTSPSTVLHVNGAVTISSNTGVGNTHFPFTDGRFYYTADPETGGTGDHVFRHYSGGSYVEQMRILENGNVGIGTTSPGSPLHLFGAGNTVDQIRISSTGGTISEYGFLAADASTNVMRYGYWTGSGFGNHHFEGNVGINDSTPSFTLDVTGGGRFTGNLRVDGGQLNLEGTNTSYPNSINFHSPNDATFWHLSAPRETESDVMRLYYNNGTSYVLNTTWDTNGDVTFSGDLRVGGAAIGTYTDYSSSVTFGGFTKGNATVVAKYAKVNKFVHYWGAVTLGSTSSMTGPLDVSLPFTAVGGFLTNNSSCSFSNLFNLFWGTALHISNSAIRLQAHLAPVSYAYNADLTSSVPFTWTPGHSFYWNHYYEAA